jgi:hypothetical protein
LEASAAETPRPAFAEESPAAELERVRIDPLASDAQQLRRLLRRQQIWRLAAWGRLAREMSLVAGIHHPQVCARS